MILYYAYLSPTHIATPKGTLFHRISSSYSCIRWVRVRGEWLRWQGLHPHVNPLATMKHTKHGWDKSFSYYEPHRNSWARKDQKMCPGTHLCVPKKRSWTQLFSKKGSCPETQRRRCAEPRESRVCLYGKQLTWRNRRLTSTTRINSFTTSGAYNMRQLINWASWYLNNISNFSPLTTFDT